MKKILSSALLFLAFITTATTASADTRYTIKGERVKASELKTDGTKYVFYNTGNNSKFFIGVSNESYVVSKTDTPDGFTTTDDSFIWKLEAGTTSGLYKIKNVGADKYCAGGTSVAEAGKDYTIGDYFNCPSKGNGVQYWIDGANVTYDNVTSDHKVLYIQDPTETSKPYWNGDGTAGFVVQAKGHAYAFYEVEETYITPQEAFRETITAFLTEDKIAKIDQADSYGCPKTTSLSYINIKDIVDRLNSEELTAEDVTNVEAYYNAYIAETDVVLPETGKFYRIFAENGGNKYLIEKDGKIYGRRTTAEALAEDASSIWYVDNNKLIVLSNGKQFAGFVGEGNNPMTCEGLEASFKKNPSAFGKVMISSETGTWFVQASVDGDSEMKSGQTNVAGAMFYIEEVTTLPITIGEAGYATLYSPVALTIPEEGVTAYTGTLNDDKTALVLTKVEGTIPAETAVVLEGTAGKYLFNITTTAEPVENGVLQGSMGIANATGLLTLQVIDDQIGFYTYNNAEGLPAFKAYITLAGTNSNALRVIFDDDITAIEGVEAADSDAAAYYDLQGRRVAAPQAGQIYIMNGKKILVK
ncbi:MAG: hypothetical protein J1F13_02380 [Prevotellaceae bacterium]|nr:hypothetical protein [Prevotellaceae bacterium]